MTDLVARARAALDGVTPGEWKWVPIGNKSSVTDSDYDVLFRAQHNPNAYADARFIAAARSLVPEMADRIAALEADLARAEAMLKEAASTLQRIVSTSQEMSADYICHGGESGHERTARIAHSTLARIKEAKDNG